MSAPSIRGPSIEVVVTEIADIARDVRRFRLAAAGETALPVFSGGAHIRLRLDVDGGPRDNAYSLIPVPGPSVSGAPVAWDIAVRREVAGRGGSRFLHDRVRVGDRLFASVPVNAFPLVRTARRHLFVAGGIGITPFLALMAEAVAEGREVELHYAVRGVDDGAFAGELRTRYGDRVRLYRSDHGERIDLERLVSRQKIGTHLHVCGPQRLIDGALAAARAARWPECHLHCEIFTPPAGGAPFSVTLARSGRDIRVAAEETLLDALQAAGADVDAMCRGGACGACETTVVACDGEILHADHWLSPARRTEGDRIVPCVSRFAGRRLILDL